MRDIYRSPENPASIKPNDLCLNQKKNLIRLDTMYFLRLIWQLEKFEPFQLQYEQWWREALEEPDPVLKYKSTVEQEADLDSHINLKLN